MAPFHSKRPIWRGVLAILVLVLLTSFLLPTLTIAQDEGSSGHTVTASAVADRFGNPVGQGVVFWLGSNTSDTYYYQYTFDGRLEFTDVEDGDYTLTIWTEDDIWGEGGGQPSKALNVNVAGADVDLGIIVLQDRLLPKLPRTPKLPAIPRLDLDRVFNREDAWVAITSPTDQSAINRLEPLEVEVDYQARHTNFKLGESPTTTIPTGMIMAIELFVNGESVGVRKTTSKSAGTTIFSVDLSTLLDDTIEPELQARAYDRYFELIITPRGIRNLMRNHIAAESEVVAVQVGVVLESPALEIEKQDETLVLSWENTQPSTNYVVQKKIDDGSFEQLSEGLGVDSYTDNDLSTYGIYTYKVIAANSRGESKESNEVHAYVSKIGSGILWVDDILTDTDGDGLTDFLEFNKFHTDPNKEDTDGDGISDGDEVFKLFTDPTKIDTDEDGVSDDQEDFDIDGIKNIDEIAEKTDPWSDDSDLDGLTDHQEIYTYYTDPNKEDTDEDGLSDNNEILQGTDPLIADTDGDGTKDGDEVFNITTEVNDTEKDAEVEPSVIMDLDGKDIGSVSISNVGESNPYLSSTIQGYIGAPYAFFTPASFDSATLKLKFDQGLLNNPDFEPAIYFFNEQTKLLELLPNQTVDLSDYTVSVDVDHFSTYILLNKNSVDDFWAREMKPPFEGELKNIELVIGFAIDSSGSMSWNDPADLRKQTAKEFVDNMDENDKAAVIDFDDTAKVNCILTNDKQLLKTCIDQIDSSGGTNLGAGIQAALAQLQTSVSEAKYIIMLTDGEGSYNSNLTQQAIDQGVTIYTIGLGSSVDVALLKSIAEATGGKYYHASTAVDLSEIFKQTSEETIDLTTDTDSDGLSDYHEKKGVRANTGWIYTEYDNPDTDGDGLEDGAELVYKDGYFEMSSDPTKEDTDNDGINDNADPEPMVYSITDRILALSASLSYTDLSSAVGSLVGDAGEPELSGFRIVDANNSGYTTLNDFFDAGLGSVAIRVSRIGKKDAVIFAIRGTEFKDDAIRDGLTDIFLGIGADTKQSDKAFKEYKKLAKDYPNADFFIAGHSLGGRLTQDVLYEVYDANDGIFGLFKSKILTPVHSGTFNALGYNKLQYFSKSLFKQGNVDSISEILNNYYYKDDFVGDGLGHSALFKRLGTDIGPWTARDENGNPIDATRIPGLNMVFSAFHGIDLWNQDSMLQYPQTDGIY